MVGGQVFQMLNLPEKDLNLILLSCLKCHLRSLFWQLTDCLLSVGFCNSAYIGLIWNFCFHFSFKLKINFYVASSLFLLWVSNGTYRFTLSNSRRFYSSMGNPLGVKGLTTWKAKDLVPVKWRQPFCLVFYSFHPSCEHVVKVNRHWYNIVSPVVFQRTTD